MKVSLRALLNYIVAAFVASVIMSTTFMLVVQLCLVSMGDSLFDNASVATLVAGIIASALFMANISYGALCIAILRQMGQANYWQAAALGSFASLIIVGAFDLPFDASVVCLLAVIGAVSAVLILRTLNALERRRSARHWRSYYPRASVRNTRQ